jgi:hypothetical protein
LPASVFIDLVQFTASAGRTCARKESLILAVIDRQMLATSTGQAPRQT